MKSNYKGRQQNVTGISLFNFTGKQYGRLNLSKHTEGFSSKGRIGDVVSYNFETYSNITRQTQSIIATLSYSVEVSRPPQKRPNNMVRLFTEAS